MRENCMQTGKGWTKKNRQKNHWEGKTEIPHIYARHCIQYCAYHYLSWYARYNVRCTHNEQQFERAPNEYYVHAAAAARMDVWVCVCVWPCYRCKCSGKYTWKTFIFQWKSSMRSFWVAIEVLGMSNTYSSHSSLFPFFSTVCR